MTFLRCFAFLALIFSSLAAEAKQRGEPVFAEAPYDAELINSITALSPTIDRNEARQVAYTAYTTGRELRRDWQVVYPPGYQNYLVTHGKRPGGYCYQFATELLHRLVPLQLKTIQLHWAESFQGTLSEHNVIVVTAIGQPFGKGILLDNWRYGGRLVWGPIRTDPHYRWTENAGELARRWPRAVATKRAAVATTARTSAPEKSPERSE
ncbi:MAG: hypothetical protein ACJ8HU_08975 [Chthoniobacterales bacterium]